MAATEAAADACAPCTGLAIGTRRLLVVDDHTFSRGLVALLATDPIAGEAADAGEARARELQPTSSARQPSLGVTGIAALAGLKEPRRGCAC